MALADNKVKIQSLLAGINALPDAGGDPTNEDGILTRALGPYYSNHRITTIGPYALYKCTSLQHASFQKVKTIGIYSFWNAGLISISLPSLTSIVDTQCFYACRALTTIDMPELLTIAGSNCFYNCTALVKADFPKLQNIAAQVFGTCSNLTTLVLRSSTACTLANANALASTPIASGTGYIYVPAALVDTYKAATNWTTYAEQFRALESYTVDGTTTGALDESKIAA